LELADSHIHLAGYADPEEVVEAARRRRVLLIAVSTGPEDARLTYSLRNRHPDVVRFFAGIHPSEATRSTVEELAEFWEGADGIGEVGLDPKYSSAGPDDPQMRTFTAQLSLAERLSKPVEVHSRGAEPQCLEHLSTFRVKRVLMHWFEAEDHLERAASRGYYVSFGPALLHSKRLRRMARSYPVDLTLLETDGPVTFRALGDSVGGGAVLASVAFAVAELRGDDFDEMAERTVKNTQTFLTGR
jgi:TatD DNase family protein